MRARAVGAGSGTGPASTPDLFEVRELSPGSYLGRCHEGTPGRAFGGHLAAQALAAAGRSVDDDRPASSLHATFLRPARSHDAVSLEVEPLVDGRSFVTRRVTARQEAGPVLTMTATFGRGGPDERGREPVGPDVVPPERLPDPYPAWLARDPDDVERAVFARHLQLRFLPAASGEQRPGVTAQDVWLRFVQALPDDTLVHRCALTYAADLLLAFTAVKGEADPRPLRVGPSRVFAASLDHTIWFHRPFRADAWLLLVQRSPSRFGGRGLTLAEVWSGDGRLVATVAQESVIRASTTTSPPTSPTDDRDTP